MKIFANFVFLFAVSTVMPVYKIISITSHISFCIIRLTSIFIVSIRLLSPASNSIFCVFEGQLYLALICVNKVLFVFVFLYFPAGTKEVLDATVGMIFGVTPSQMSLLYFLHYVHCAGGFSVIVDADEKGYAQEWRIKVKMNASPVEEMFGN